MIRRQRCVWCGALLQEYDLSNIARPLEPGEDPENTKSWEPAEWAVGEQVAVDGNASWVVEPEVEIDPETKEEVVQVPPSSCMALDPAITI